MNSNQPCLIIIHCNTLKEAEKIGKKLLKERLVACVDMVTRPKSFYFWPPQKNKIKKGKGSILYASTLAKHIHHIEYLVEKIHSDKVPFIAAVELSHLNKPYLSWLTLELK